MTIFPLAVLIAAAFSAGAVARADDEQGKPDAESGKAKEILKKSQEALRKVKLARYTGKYTGTEWVRQYVPDIDGSSSIGEPSEYDIARFLCNVKMTPHGSEEVIDVTAGSDGDLFYLVDAKKKKVYADIDEAVLGTHARDVQRLLLRDFIAKEPLATELGAEKVELKEPVDIGGQACHQVHVTFSDTRSTVWFISKKDWLPRRVDRLYKNEEGELGMTRLVISDLVASPTLDTAPFKLTVPEGYTKTDEFAP
jgi:outer membrane lipoprotein-sorting protein